MARVLIIDDSLAVAFVAAESLRLEGHEVETLGRFGPLPELLSRFPPEVIVLDLMMPGFNGIQFAQFIRRFVENVPPIILHSGGDRELVRVAAREVRPFEIVAKTTDAVELCAVVRRALAARSVTDHDRHDSTRPHER